MTSQKSTEEKIFDIVVKITKENDNIEVFYKKERREIDVIYKNELLSRVTTNHLNLFNSEKGFSIFVNFNSITIQEMTVHKYVDEMEEEIGNFISNSINDTIELIEQRRRERNIEDNFILEFIKDLPNVTYDSSLSTLEYKDYFLDIFIKDGNVFTFLNIGEQWCDNISKEIEINKAIRIIDILNEEN